MKRYSLKSDAMGVIRECDDGALTYYHDAMEEIEKLRSCLSEARFAAAILYRHGNLEYVSLSDLAEAIEIADQASVSLRRIDRQTQKDR